MRCLVYILFLIGFVANAQNNLVPNPSFEELKPTKASRTFNHFSEPFHVPIVPWYIPTKGTSDYYNSDRSAVYLTMPVKNARTGNGRIGLVLHSGFPNENYCEYLQVKLKAPLQKDSLYCVAFHFSIDKRCRFYAPSLGMAFTNEAFTQNDVKPLSVTAQMVCADSAKNNTTYGWQEYTELYRAKGGEQYLTLGRFDTLRPGAHVLEQPVPETMQNFSMYAYYYFDDISVIPLGKNGTCNTETIASAVTPGNHFLFLVDVSASMAKAGYLDSVKNTLRHFISGLAKNDWISLLAFDAHTYTLLQAQPAGHHEKIWQAIDRLNAGTTTNIEKALVRAYATMDSLMIPGAASKVILLSDAKFDLSKAGEKNIRTHFVQKGVSFSMIQFGPATNKKMDKLTRTVNGEYTLAKTGEVNSALRRQVYKPLPKPDYTWKRQGVTWESK